jgi:hypothetical protein
VIALLVAGLASGGCGSGPGGCSGELQECHDDTDCCELLVCVYDKSQGHSYCLGPALTALPTDR